MLRESSAAQRTRPPLKAPAIARLLIFSRSYLTLAKFAFGTVLFAHWMACLVHLISVASNEECNWCVLGEGRAAERELERGCCDERSYPGPGCVTAHVA